MGILSNNKNENNLDRVANLNNPISKKALIIFTKNPELGKCKTRLAKTIGNKAALEVYKHLLQHTSTVTEQIQADKFVFYSESIRKNDIWDDIIFRKKFQQGNDLGDKMKQAFNELFQSGYEKVVIIGSDLFDLEVGHINNAFDALDTTQCVLGPAQDGGYYLLGLTKMLPFIFENKSWSTSKLWTETLNDLKENSVAFTTLEILNDIDTFDDLTASKSYQSNAELQQKIKQIHD
ncbi:TIGR04282 family arsenosugar biosynthesis glycosyltransferase [Flavobacteriaceae bacterium XHP0103]|uniref:TIGR04282 family arsenosugar biosynthesis glycosyltransferase n=1 Tax=Marixanthotalea marina TaxID=2844359 RepID=UPI002989AF2B|nr:TIGR04282 family arsenosugar biosynthesis glycosyltransferase [Marixanthotalea marina]MBU3821037.1 TIGR04282 family arsenosugar biosynthesis glycosyltransferase [Marixanthotalea marina]